MDSYRIGQVTEEDWDSVLAGFSQRTVFHSMPWLKVLRASHGLKMMLVEAHDDDDRIAVWPLLQTRKGPFKILGSPLPGWSTPYLGPLFKDSVSARGIIGAFLNHPMFQGSAYFACKVLETADRIDLSGFGFSQTLRYETYRLDLSQSEDHLWNNCRRECRNHIRKAVKLNVEIREESSADFIDEYWAMTTETFAKNAVQPTHSRKFIDELWRIGHPAGIVRALSAFHDGHRVGSIMLPHDDRTMYYWAGAAHLEYRHLSASNLLQWEAIRLAKQLGKTTYDFISTTGGPGKFKQSFGPKAVPISTHWERSGSRLMAMLKNRYAQYLRRKQRIAVPA